LSGDYPTSIQALRKILIFGNSSSGKSTLAKKLCKAHDLTHLDLDTLAWKATTPPERKPLEESQKEIESFIGLNTGWVIEGCYTDLLELAEEYCNEIVFMNLSIKACILNAKSRPWEPHKYDTKRAQDANLKMLISWIEQYTQRKDTSSATAHRKFYEHCICDKRIFTYNENHT